MAREFAKKFYNSSQWKKTRESYMHSIHWLCERCKCNTAYIVHHKTYLSPSNINKPEITLNFDNLEGLCLDCHNDEHMPSKTTVKGVRFDEDGNLIEY